MAYCDLWMYLNNELTQYPSWLRPAPVGSRLEHENGDQAQVMQKIERLNWLHQIGNALAHMHSHGIVHCDLKPGNCLLFNDGRNGSLVKLSDFGHSMTDGYGHIGTYEYLHPRFFHEIEKQAEGRLYFHKSACSNVEDDNYALTVLGQEILTGRNEFAGKRLSEIVCAKKAIDLQKLHVKSLPEMLFLGENQIASYSALTDLYSASYGWL